MWFYGLPIFDGVIMDGHQIFRVVDADVADILPWLKYWMPIHYNTNKDVEKKIASFILILI